MSRIISENKVAVKSGYYFEIFDKSEIPSTLSNYGKKVELRSVIYDLYQGTSMEDEKLINSMFGDRMGYSIDEHIIKKPKYALIGQDGNIFNLMGIASRTLRNNNMKEEAKEMVIRIEESKSYDEALCIIGEYVEITDGAGLENKEYEEEY